ncbi:MAG: molybdate ABC transporter substrate-binding protein [Sphingobium sp.]|nr:molybdate ABC transporter substrate-binding protein [Sphingobium sp.]
MSQLARRLFVALCITLLATPALAQTKRPLVLAAASLQESLTAAADAWTAKGHARPVLSFAASSALARQVEAGGPADIFISADEPWMDEVAQRGLIVPGSRKSFLANRLVLVAPVDSKLRLAIGKSFPVAQALGADGRLAMADPEGVPAGKYGKAALTTLGIWPAVSGKIASAENVRAALALVERGAAPLGIVYATDARASKLVRVVGTFPANTHPPITYPLARLKASASKEAEAFRKFLISREGQAIFIRYGFSAK